MTNPAQPWLSGIPAQPQPQQPGPQAQPWQQPQAPQQPQVQPWQQPAPQAQPVPQAQPWQQPVPQAQPWQQPAPAPQVQPAPQGWQPPAQQPAQPAQVPQGWQPPPSAPQQWNPQSQSQPQAPAGYPAGYPGAGGQAGHPPPAGWVQPGQPQAYGYPQPPQQNWGQEDPFAGLDAAMPQGQQGEFFEAGSFHVRITGIKMVTSRKSSKNLYTIETEVLASDSPDQPAGTRCTAMVDMSNRDMRDKNLKTFLAAVMGYDPGQFPKDAMPPTGGTWSNLARETLMPHQPIVGYELALRAVDREKRDGSGEFTDLGWLPKAMLQIGPMRPSRPAQQAQPSFGGPPMSAPGFTQPGFGGPPGQPGFGAPAFGAPLAGSGGRPPQGATPGGFPPNNSYPGAPNGQPPNGQRSPQNQPMAWVAGQDEIPF